MPLCLGNMLVAISFGMWFCATQILALNIKTSRLYHEDITCLDPDWHGPFAHGKGSPDDCVTLIRFLAKILKQTGFQMEADRPGERQTSMETADRYEYKTCVIMYQGWRTAMPKPQSRPPPTRPSSPQSSEQAEQSSGAAEQSADLGSTPLQLNPFRPQNLLSGPSDVQAAQEITPAVPQDVGIVRRAFYPEFTWDDLGRTARDISNQCFLRRGGKVGFTKYKALDSDRRELVEVNLMLGRSIDRMTNEVLWASELSMDGDPFPQLRKTPQAPSWGQAMEYCKCRGCTCWTAFKEDIFPKVNNFLWNELTITTVNYCAAVFATVGFVYMLHPPAPNCNCVCPPATGP